MPAAPPPPPADPAIVARLRAAGCVFAEDEADLIARSAGTPAEVAAMVDRRVAGVPLEHVLGWVDFHGLRIAVDPGVFVPRRRTAFLVDRAIVLLASGAAGHRPARPTVLVDLCCGCGAIGAALATALRSSAGPVEVHAADIDPAAVACARRNLAPLRGLVYQGDLDAPLPATLRGRVDILAANVPYVPTGEIALMPPEARDHEPRVALDGGADGLDIARRLAAAAPRWLAPGGHVLIETSERQAPAAARLFTVHGLVAEAATDVDLNATVVVGTLVAPRAATASPRRRQGRRLTRPAEHPGRPG